MWPPVNRLALLICSLCLISSLPAVADERQEQRDAERGRFAVAIGIASGVLIAQENGSIDKTVTNLTPTPTGVGCRNGNLNVAVPCKTPAPFGPNVNSSTNSVSPNVGVNLELFAPAFEFVPTKPRFFAAVEYLPTFAANLTVALDGAATTFLVPDQRPSTFGASSIGGQGSRLTAQVMTSVVTADAGLAFDFEFKERLFRFKPFAGWIRWGVVSDGRVLAAFKNDPVTASTNPIQSNFFGDNIRLVTATGHGSGFFNGVGPGFELEMELAKRGPLRPILYITGAGYKTVGTDWFEYKASTSVQDNFYAAAAIPPSAQPPFPGAPAVTGPLATATYNATWTFQVDEWSYRAGLGMRLRWVGFD